jgi:phage FluMu protein Com
MNVRFQCSCGQKLSIKDEAAGKKVRCPRCKTVQSAPQPLLPHSEIMEIADDEEPTKIMDALDSPPREP